MWTKIREQGAGVIYLRSSSTLLYKDTASVQQGTGTGSTLIIWSKVTKECFSEAAEAEIDHQK